MRHWLTALVTLVLGGCSGAIFDVPSHQPSPYETVHIFYRPLVAAAVRPLTGTSEIQISELKKSVAPQPGDWATCVRAWKDGKLLYLSVFIRDRAVFDTRHALIIDRCEEEQYSAV